MIINDFLHYSSIHDGSNGERTIFGSGNKKLQYEYSDRLVQYDYNKHSKAWNECKNERHASEFYQEYLSAYFGRDIDLQHIVIGVNRSTGYSYLIFGFEGANS